MKRSSLGFVTLMFFTFKKSWWKNHEFFFAVFRLFCIIATFAVAGAILHFPGVLYIVRGWCHRAHQCQFTRWIQFFIAISSASEKEIKVKDLLYLESGFHKPGSRHLFFWLCFALFCLLLFRRPLRVSR